MAAPGLSLTAFNAVRRARQRLADFRFGEHRMQHRVGHQRQAAVEVLLQKLGRDRGRLPVRPAEERPAQAVELLGELVGGPLRRAPRAAASAVMLASPASPAGSDSVAAFHQHTEVHQRKPGLRREIDDRAVRQRFPRVRRQLDLRGERRAHRQREIQRFIASPPASRESASRPSGSWA